MMYCYHQDFIFPNHIVEPIKFEPSQGCPTHIGKTNAMNFSVMSQIVSGCVYLGHEFRAQSWHLRIIPKRCFDSVNFGG